MHKYRVKRCCEHCGRWELWQGPRPLFDHFHYSWNEAMDDVNRLIAKDRRRVQNLSRR